MQLRFDTHTMALVFAHHSIIILFSMKKIFHKRKEMKMKNKRTFSTNTEVFIINTVYTSAWQVKPGSSQSGLTKMLHCWNHKTQ